MTLKQLHQIIIQKARLEEWSNLSKEEIDNILENNL
jgi:hypothetical protein